MTVGLLQFSCPNLPPTGRVLIGSALGDPGVFKNIMLNAPNFSVNDPTLINDDGYPNNTASFTGTCQFQSLRMASDITTSTTMVLKWSGTGDVTITRGAPGFTNAVATSGSIVGGTSFNLRLQGANARCTFQFATSVPGASSGGINIVFTNTGTFSSMSGLVLCDLADETSIDAATTPAQYFKSNYVSAYANLAPKVFRPMGWTSPNNASMSQSKYIATWNTSLNVSSARWDSGAWAGSTSGNNAYTCASQPDATGSYVDGETIQLLFVSALSGANPTINSGSRGAVPLYLGSGGNSGLAVSSISANTLATLVYNRIMGGFLMYTNAGGALTGMMPYEFQIAFANLINSHYWCNFPANFDDTSIAAITTLVQTNLNTDANAYFEFGNEIWNNTFAATKIATANGAALNFPTDNNRQPYGWYALRTRQIMAIVSSNWSASTSRLKRVMAFQAVFTSAAVDLYRFDGGDLSTSLGYAGYNSLIGVSYNTAPNRPIDYCDVLSYAPYWSGGELMQFDTWYAPTFSGNGSTAKIITNITVGSTTVVTSPSHGYSTGNRIQFDPAAGGVTLLSCAYATVTVIDSTSYSVPIDTSTGTYTSSGQTKILPISSGLTNVTDLYATGISSNITAAYQWITADLSSGTNNSATTPLNLAYYNSTSTTNGPYRHWESIAASSDYPTLTVELYEGGYGANYPSTTTCVSMGINSSYGGATGLIEQMLTGYKHSSYFYNDTMKYYQQFMGTYAGDPNFGLLPHSATPAQLLLPGPNPWSLSSGDTFVTPYYQSYDAMTDYDHGIG